MISTNTFSVDKRDSLRAVMVAKEAATFLPTTDNTQPIRLHGWESPWPYLDNDVIIIFVPSFI